MTGYIKTKGSDNSREEVLAAGLLETEETWMDAC